MIDMKKIALLALLAGILVGCGGKNPSWETLRKGIVTGRANNLPAGTNELAVSLERPGFETEQRQVTVDGAGNFSLGFESCAPVSVSIQALSTADLVLLPGDSLHVEFDAGTRNPDTFFKSLVFNGDRAGMNRDIAAFHFLYAVDPVLPIEGRNVLAVKRYTPEQYLLFLDTLQNRWDNLYDLYIQHFSPGREARQWAKIHIRTQRVNRIGEYCTKIEQNVHYGEREFPQTFRDRMLELTPLSEAMFIDAASINAYTSLFNQSCLNPLILKYMQDHGLVSEEGEFIGTEQQAASIHLLLLEKMAKYTEDPLLRQLVLTRQVEQYLHEGFSGTLFYDKNIDFIDRNISLPALRKPLDELYLVEKDHY
jgi:hypothetical protein